MAARTSHERSHERSAHVASSARPATLFHHQTPGARRALAPSSVRAFSRPRVRARRYIQHTSKLCPNVGCGNRISHFHGHACHHISPQTDGCPACHQHFVRENANATPTRDSARVPGGPTSRPLTRPQTPPRCAAHRLALNSLRPRSDSATCAAAATACLAATVATHCAHMAHRSAQTLTSTRTS